MISIIIASIIIILIILVPVKLEILVKNEKLDFFISLFFLKFKISGKKNKKIEKSNNRQIRSGNFIEKLKFFFSNFGLVLSLFKFVLKKLKFETIHFTICVCGNDAHECALSYSYAYSFLEFLIRALNLNKKTKDLRIKIFPDFLSFKTTYCGQIVLKVTLLEIICFLFYYLSEFRLKTVRE